MADNSKRGAAAMAAIVAWLLLCGAAAAGPPSAASSEAYGIYAQFHRNGNVVTLGPLADIRGKLPPPYEDRVVVGRVRQVVPIVAGPMPVPSFFVDAADFASHVASSGFAVDSISAEADTVAKRLSLALMLNPPPPVAAVQRRQPVPFLTLSADSIKSAADFSLVVPRYTTALGSAAFEHLRVGGSLVGNQMLEFSGSAGKDTILYQSPQLMITLNQEVVVGLISCSAKCIFTPNSITTYAVDIVLDRADLDGRTVSGEILLGAASAE
jgi:hypothetical protein